MKIKKIYNNEALRKGELNLANDEVIITMNGEEFTKLLIATAQGKLEGKIEATEIYEKLINCKVESLWKE